MEPAQNRVEKYRSILLKIFEQWRQWPGPQAKFTIEVSVDREQEHYFLLEKGWDGDKRIYGVFAHVEIRDGKLWIEEDNTPEGIATELTAAGVPKEHIVLAFYPVSIRKWGEYAVA